MILCIDYVSNGIESNSCETVVFEKYHFVHITAYYVYRQNLHKYIKLVYDTPERDYNYYKKYIYDGNLLNKDYKENETIHNIFKEINTIRDQ